MGSGIDGQGLTNYGNSSVDVQLAAGMAGGRRKRKGGAPYGNGFSPASAMGSGIDGQGITNYGNNSTDVQLAAGMAGGGKGYGWLSGSGTDGQGVTNYGNSSIDVQLAAGMAGGRRRKGKGRKGSRRSRRGGTSKQPAVQIQITH